MEILCFLVDKPIPALSSLFCVHVVSQLVEQQPILAGSFTVLLMPRRVGLLDVVDGKKLWFFCVNFSGHHGVKASGHGRQNYGILHI